MPYQVQGNLWVYCEEEFPVNVVGKERHRHIIKHEAGNKSPIVLTCEKIWSYDKLTVPWPAGLTLDLSDLPQGIPGYTKDLATDQNLNLWLIDNWSETAQITIQLLGPGMAPLPGVGYALGPSNILAQYDDKGEALLSQFIIGMQFDVILGDVDAEIDILLGTVSTLPPV